MAQEYVQVPPPGGGPNVEALPRVNDQGDSVFRQVIDLEGAAGTNALMLLQQILFEMRMLRTAIEHELRIVGNTYENEREQT